MLRTLRHEAAALAAIGLFVAMIGVWAGVFGEVL